MAIIGVQITKRDTWEGNPEEFSNVYHYDTEQGIPDIVFPGISDTDAERLINIIADLERPVHSTETEFIRGRAWGPVDAPPAENQTLAVVDLGGFGEHLPDAQACLEDTMMIRFRTRRRSVRDRPVWLRKWYRTMGSPNPAANDFGDEVHARRSSIPADQRSALSDFATRFLVLDLLELGSFPDELVLASPAGRQLTDYLSPEFEVYPFLQTHDVKY